MKFNITAGWWALPIAIMWVWLASMLFLGRMSSVEVAEFFLPFLLITVMCLLTRFLP